MEDVYNHRLDKLKCWGCGKHSSEITHICPVYNEGLGSIIGFCENCKDNIHNAVNKMKANKWYSIHFREIQAAK